MLTLSTTSAFRKALVSALAALAFGSAASISHAQYLDITSLTTGPNGSFAGTLNGVAVTGAIAPNDGSFSFSGTGTGVAGSTINGTSPQYRASNIYSPFVAATDRIGYIKTASGGTATVTIVFASAITNPVFQVANLDGALFDFAPTSGLTGLVLLSGNGGGGDGLGISGTTIVDLDPTTSVNNAPGAVPPTANPRSAYGSVELMGTFTTLTFNAVTSDFTGPDGGSFTLSAAPTAVPEPGSIALLLGMGVTGAGFLRKRRRK